MSQKVENIIECIPWDCSAFFTVSSLTDLFRQTSSNCKLQLTGGCCGHYGWSVSGQSVVSVFQDASAGILWYDTGTKQAHNVPNIHRWRRCLGQQPARCFLSVRPIPAQQASGQAFHCTVGGLYSGWAVQWVGCTAGGLYSGWAVQWEGWTVGGLSSGWAVQWVGCTAGALYSGWAVQWVGCTVGGLYSGWAVHWVQFIRLKSGWCEYFKTLGLLKMV